MKFYFEVGASEKHKVDFSWSQMTGALEIKVDGIVIQNEAFTLMSPMNIRGNLDEPESEKWNVKGLEIQLVKKWSFEVGVNERHKVRIEKERAKIAAAFRPQKYRVFIDNQFVKEYKGY